MDEKAVVKALAALAQPVRLQVFRALMVTGEAGLIPSVMSEGLGIPANTLSFHLKELTNAGLVQPQRLGRHLVYRAEPAQMQALLTYLSEKCCQDASAAPSTTRRRR